MAFGEDIFGDRIQKKCSEWYKQIQSPFLREKVFENLIHKDAVAYNIGDAIDKGFTWSSTPEGDRFWSKFNEFYSYNVGYEVDIIPIKKYKVGDNLMEILSVRKDRLLSMNIRVSLIMLTSDNRYLNMVGYSLSEFLEKVKKGEFIEQEENKGNV